MVKALQSCGMQVQVLCATAADPRRDNGDVLVDRHVPHGNFETASWRPRKDANLLGVMRELAKHYEFINTAVAWCRANRITVALMGSPLQFAHMHHFRELYMRLKDMGIAVGLINHDISRPIEESLGEVHMREPGGWQHAASWVTEQIRQLAGAGGSMSAALISGTAMLFEPDFIISNSHWSARFVDPLESVPHFILHPLMDRAYWTGPPATALAPVDVLMVNPQTRKGPEVMKSVIANAGPARRFRLLEGGWGNAFASFAPSIAGLAAAREGRVELLDYVRDMRTAYRAAGVLVYPSLAEGYGMVPVEAMMCGTPVVSSNYPAILEAVGEGALTLCPKRDGPAAWHGAVETVLSNRDAWRRRARERIEFLDRRQAAELQALPEFLLAQSR